MTDQYNLERFVKAQRGAYDRALSELRFGQKRGHWMWYVFPQIKGLGKSEMAIRYAISNAEEALAYFDHNILGPRLEECTILATEANAKRAIEIFGFVDDMKFRSCMTLFSEVTPNSEVFGLALAKYYSGRPDPLTLALLSNPA